MMDKEIIHKELDLIQDVIKRMADNSFKVKAWFMAILSAVIALSKDILFVNTTTSFNPSAAYIIGIFLVVIVIVFWYLDGFFLRTEKLYRALYQWVVVNRKDSDEYLYDLNTFERTINEETENLQEEAGTITAAMFSKTLGPFYILPLLFVIVLLAIQFF